MATAAALLPPGHRAGGSGGEDHAQPRSGHTPAAAAAVGAPAAALRPPRFRYWVDELLWSHGRVATVTIEEVLDELGGQRTGGPHKPPAAAVAAAAGAAATAPASAAAAAAAAKSDQYHLNLPQLLQQTQLTSSSSGGGGGSTDTLSGRSSSAGSLDAAAIAAGGGGTRSSSKAAAAIDAAAGSGLLKTHHGRQPRAGAAVAAADGSSSSSGGSDQHEQLDSGSGGSDTAAAAAAAGSGFLRLGSSTAAGGGSGGASSSSSAAAKAQRADDHLLGCHHMQQWDLLWTKSVYAIRAARALRPGQLVSAIAGLNCLSMKKRMVQTLRMALGPEQAFQIVPLSFCIPEDLQAWQAWLSSPAGAATDTGLWMLKTGQDAGKGLRLAHTAQALHVATRRPRNPAKPQSHIQVAQQYITRPLLLRGRKFHLRLWLLVAGHAPLRAYLHSQGLVLFSSEAYDSRRPLEHGAGVRPSVGHVTNYARNEDTWVWGLQRLAQELGAGRWAALWAAMQAASALTAAAALGPLRAANRWLQPGIPSYGFQMLGLDFLIDEALHPWLLEVNSAPSIMAVHSSPATCSLIRSTKQAMLRDMLCMVQHRVRNTSGGGSSSGGGGGRKVSAPAACMMWQQELAAEMASRGGFEPLMPLFPVRQSSRLQHSGSGSSGAAGGGGPGVSGSGSGSGGCNIPWTEADVQLQRLMAAQYAGEWGPQH